MMFSSSSLDKNCINPDSCSSSRNNSPNRFSVGITPLGDENQHIRIQLAVHKYNGTGSPFTNRCSFMSPIRHSLLKNSLKIRNYEGDHEGTSKTDKRNGNQYEGVGAFPTIHLKKNAVRYRPIKRFHDVKIPYPELPVNRFLSHLPEVCPDLKTSTRSVLDVLEDLSGNKIHSKDDNNSSKPKPRGLGGDYLLNPNAVFKPLFVQKPKLNTVLTRDNTTQTLSPISIETPSSQNSSSSCIRNGPSDPRAELRRKLAKQNNEIFASLSSSISSAFCLKRKIDKVLPSRDDGQLGEGSVLKKTKILNHCSCELNENGIAKSVITPTINSSESVKLNRKSKFSDTSSVSPNKDRLTTIFLDTRNTSPKARVFQANTSTESKFIEKDLQMTSNCLLETNGESVDKIESPPANSFAGGKGKDESIQSSINFSSSGKSASCASDKQEMEQSDKTVVTFLTSKSNTSSKDTAKWTSSTLQLDVSAADTSNFSSPKMLIGNVSSATESPKSPEKGNDSEKKDNNGKDTSKGFVFRNSNDKPNFGSFKFGVDGSTPSVQNKIFTDFKRTTTEAALTGDPIATNPTTQFSLGTTSSGTASLLQNPALHFSVTSSQNTLNSPAKTTFTFGHTPSPSQPKSTDIDGNQGTSNAVPTSTTSTITTTQSTQPVSFTFGLQKPNVSSAPECARQDALSPANQMSQSKAVGVAENFNKTSPSSVETSGPAFVLGQKPEISVTSAGPAAVVQEQTKTFPFAFGQKSDVGQNETQTESGQKSANLFSTEQKLVSQPSTQGSAVSTDVTAPSQSSTTQMNQTFAQTVSLASITPHVTFTQNSASQISTTFGTKFEGSSLGGIPTPGFNSTNPVFSNKTPSFGSSINAFVKTTAQTTTGFAASTSSAPVFSFEVPTTTQPLPTFGISSVTQSAPTFAPSSTTQSTSAFANAPAVQTAPAIGPSVSHSTPGFVISPTTQTPPTFGVSSAPHSTPTFGSSNEQSVPSFGTTSNTQSTPTFPGVSSQPSPPFGTSNTTQTTFAAPAGFGLCSSQTSTVFGAPTSTQSTMRFGLTTTQNNTSFGPSTGFSTPPSTQPATVFGTPAATSAPAFAAAHSLDNKPVACPNSPNIFVQNPSPPFSSTTAFTSNQNNIFARKPATETTVFGQNKLQTSGFGSTSQTFGVNPQNKFSFGMSTTNASGFTTSSPTTTSPLVFSFGGSTSGNAFTFGSNSSGSNNTQTPFAFRSPANEPFKFGATTTTAATTTTTTTKGVPPFGGGGSASFSFGSQMSNPPVAEQKSSFNFGSTQTSTAAPGFNFGTTPSPPSVFNFGGSTSSASSGSNFNFGTPTGGVAFGQATSGAPFAVPGTFNIGSGSSQSRPRASSRPRRRP